MKLTANIKLIVPEEEKQKFFELMEIYRQATNTVSKYAFDNKVFNNIKLQKICYHEVRALYPTLNSGMVSSIIRDVCGNYKSQITSIKKHNKKKGKKKRDISLIESKKYPTIVYDSRNSKFIEEKKKINVWCFGRILLDYVCSEREVELLKKQKGEFDLIFRKNQFFVYFVYDEQEQPMKENKEFIGVDLGINNIAALDDGSIFGGDEIKDYRWKRLKIRKSLQSKAHKNSGSSRKNCRRVLKRLSGLEKRYANWVNHNISKVIVQQALVQGKGIAFENLEGIRKNERKQSKKNRYRLSNWSFYQLFVYSEYKAKLLGIPVVKVLSAFTSVTCSKCGEIGVRKQDVFRCTTCGYTDHADVNAAKNIAARGGFACTPLKTGCNIVSVD